MPLRRMLPYVAILVVGQAVLDAGPAIIAEREGGMGLGSALIAALVTQIAGIVLGATVAGHLVDRRSAAAAMVTGALLTYVGLMVTGISPMGALGSVVLGMGVAGVGFGALLAGSFSVAAAIDAPRARAAAIVLLLAAPIVARLMVGTAFAAGPSAFVVGGAAIVGLALLAVRLSTTPHAAFLAPRDSTRPQARSPGSTVLWATLLAMGALLAVAGADPSRLSATLVAGTLGLGGLDTIDAARFAMFAIGVTLVALGAAVLLRGTERRVRIAAPAALLVGFAGSGIVAAMTQALTAGRIPDGTSAFIGGATAIGGVVGLAVGGLLVGRHRSARPAAIAGNAMLTVVCVIGWLTLLGQRPDAGDATPIALIAAASFALGLTASALRFALAEIEPPQLGLAAGAGVAAAVVGTSLGGLIGAGEGLGLLDGPPRGVAFGLIGFAVAAALAAAAAAALPAPGQSGRSGSDHDGAEDAPR